MVLSSGAYRETPVSHLEFGPKYSLPEMFLMRDPRLSSSTEEYIQPPYCQHLSKRGILKTELFTSIVC